MKGLGAHAHESRALQNSCSERLCKIHRKISSAEACVSEVAGPGLRLYKKMTPCQAFSCMQNFGGTFFNRISPDHSSFLKRFSVKSG